MSVCHPLNASVLVVAALLLSGVVSNAQQVAAPGAKGPPNALQGFSQNRDEPVHIESATLEVRDKDKMATFSGDVRVKQGDTGLRSKTLMVFYEQDAAEGAKSMPAAQPGPGGEQKIKRLEARGSVVVTQKEQTATGELGIFDMKTNTVTLTGNVMMTQGKNVLRGDKLVVDLTTGVSRVESGKNGTGRVQGLFLPSSQPDLVKPGTAAPAPSGSGTLRSPVPVKPFN
jgi:lipopolysaccharide export system protein LptA